MERYIDKHITEVISFFPHLIITYKNSVIDVKGLKYHFSFTDIGYPFLKIRPCFFQYPTMELVDILRTRICSENQKNPLLDLCQQVEILIK